MRSIQRIFQRICAFFLTLSLVAADPAAAQAAVSHSPYLNNSRASCRVLWNAEALGVATLSPLRRLLHPNHSFSQLLSGARAAGVGHALSVKPEGDDLQFTLLNGQILPGDIAGATAYTRE